MPDLTTTATNVIRFEFSLTFMQGVIAFFALCALWRIGDKVGTLTRVMIEIAKRSRLEGGE